jgi:ribonucleotide reductase beta subunit family protein with ferritin-like domain
LLQLLNASCAAKQEHPILLIALFSSQQQQVDFFQDDPWRYLIMEDLLQRLSY